LTISSSGWSGGEGPRSHIQVLANSGVASLLVLVHVFKHGYHFSASSPSVNNAVCWGFGNDLLLFGIVSNYAAVAADTLSSELGILAQSQPRLITTGKSVPRGTNGGVTVEGLFAGILGSGIIATVCCVVGTFCPSLTQGWLQRLVEWSTRDKIMFALTTTIWGALGSVLDSILGALLQASVIDRRTGRVIEGIGGTKVLISGRRDSGISEVHKSNLGTEAEKTKPLATQAESRIINSGRDILDNNQINLLMAGIMSLCGMIGASWLWQIPLSEIVK
jgi:uncharacterized membrane protein